MFRERARTEHRSELASAGAEQLARVMRSFCAETFTHRGEARMPSPIPSVFSFEFSTFESGLLDSAEMQTFRGGLPSS